ncbi:MAG: FAD-dependent oxidoreductase, partial [Pyrinomonadaceae bacterium]
DMLGGGSHVAHAPLVVNAAGPWVDKVLAGSNSSGESSGEKLIGGTKGSHVVVAAFDGAPKVALYTEARADGRPFFIIPWDGKILIGTTDTRYDEDLDRVEACEAESAYLLDETNRVVPSARLTRASVLYTYSGVRPLPFVREGAEARITRRHFVLKDTQNLRGLISIVGGKLTTYRNLSEETVDVIVERLDRPRAPCLTARTTLPGAATADYERFVKAFKEESALPSHTNERLLKIYGVRAAEVARLAVEDVGLRREISAETGSIGAEVLFSFQSEMAETLADCLLRRTLVGLNSKCGLDAIEAAARIAREYLGWDEDRAARETTAYREYVARFDPSTTEKVEPGSDGKTLSRKPAR